MKQLAWIITSINLLFGLNALLNAVGFLRSSKYSRTTTWFVALLFLALAVYSINHLLSNGGAKQALWLSLAPWLIAVVVMFFALVLGNWQ